MVCYPYCCPRHCYIAYASTAVIKSECQLEARVTRERTLQANTQCDQIKPALEMPLHYFLAKETGNVDSLEIPVPEQTVLVDCDYFQQCL